MLIDRHGRPLNSLRISVTRRCNLNCLHCEREPNAGKGNEMSSKEIGKIAKIARELGIGKVKIAGGEPLARGDICKVVAAVRKAGIGEISLSTNGKYLARYASRLKRAGLSRVDVGCEYPGIAKFGKQIGGIKRGIEKANEAGLAPLSISLTVMKGKDDAEIWKMFDFAKSRGATLRLVELMNMGGGAERLFEKHYAPLSEVENELEKRKHAVFENAARGSRIYYVEGGKIELMKSGHNSRACGKCAGMNVSADGKLKPCVMRDDNHVDILGAMRKGAKDDELKHLFMRAVEQREPYSR